MLSSLLPGFRELRAPLTAGSLLLAGLYVLLATTLDDVSEEQRLGSGLVRLGDQIGSRGWLVVASVFAYLLGSLYMTLATRTLRKMAKARLVRITEPAYVWGNAQTFRLAMMAPFSRTSLRRLGVLMRPDDLESVDLETDFNQETARQLASDVLFSGGKRLLVANKDMYGEYDRMRSEADFRDAVAMPGLGAVAIVLLNVEIDWWVKAMVLIIAVCVAAALFAAARALDREAYSLYSHAVADGVVSTSTLDETPSRANY